VKKTPQSLVSLSIAMEIQSMIQRQRNA